MVFAGRPRKIHHSRNFPDPSGLVSSEIVTLGMECLRGDFMKRIASFVVMGSMALTTLGSIAVADDRGTSYEDRNGVKWYANYGYDKGLKDGQHSGHDDAEHGFRFRAADHGQFKGGLDGYRGKCTKEEYKQAYRAGYMKGYRTAYDETMRSFGYRQVR